MDVKSVEKSVNMLAGSLHMRMDFNQFNKGEKKLLIVEGQTDERFIKGHLQDDVLCMVANKAFGTNNGFSPRPPLNCKEAIIEVVYGLSVWPTIIKCPPGSEKWKVYGMIDMDFDPSTVHTNTPKLFITDTHDLETLMLSTDDTVLQRIDGCPISAKEANAALFMAYQLGKMRLIIKGQISAGPISAGKKEVDYSQFVQQGYQISLPALLSYINRNSDAPLSAAKEKKLKGQLVKDKGIKKYLDSDGCWTGDVEKFNPSELSDFWEIVNGHDILSLLKYLSENAAQKFKNRNAYSLNREFEIAMIDTYDQSNFKKTMLYSKMSNEQIVNS